jgi:hypothetical protein
MHYTILVYIHGIYNIKFLLLVNCAWFALLVEKLSRYSDYTSSSSSLAYGPYGLTSVSFTMTAHTNVFCFLPPSLDIQSLQFNQRLLQNDSTYRCLLLPSSVS